MTRSNMSLERTAFGGRSTPAFGVKSGQRSLSTRVDVLPR